MDRINLLKEEINELYSAKNPTRADWADWLYENHIFVAADYAEKIAERFEAKKELAMAAAMLHDIADAVIKREDSKHEEETFNISRRLLEKAGFASDEISIIVDDAIKFHSCHGNQTPKTLEGKVTAAADALCHLKTDFYKHALGELKGKKSPEEITKWVLEKIDRDLNQKIFFKEIREEARSAYEKLHSYILKNVGM